MIAGHCVTAGDIQHLQQLGLRHNHRDASSLQVGVYRLAPLIQPREGLGQPRLACCPKANNRSLRDKIARS
jgi:hypothetical protein